MEKNINNNLDNEYISVIIPIYNSEDTLANTLNSVINQTYKKLEIILINDGSTDNSIDICKQYQQTDNRILLINQKNRGVGEARNAGLSKATGKFVTFVDSDDSLDKNFLKNLYETAIKYDASVVEGGIKVIFENGSIVPYSVGEEIVVLNKEEMLKRYLSFELSNAVWGKLYKLDLIKDLTFPATNINEDFISLWDSLIKSNVFCHDIRSNYNHFFNNPNSLVHTHFGKDSMLLIHYADKILYDIKNMYPVLTNEAINHYNAALLHNLLICLDTLAKEKFELEYLDDVKQMLDKAKSVKNMDKYFISIEEGIDIQNVVTQIDKILKKNWG